jgi:hypothetical protein
MRPRPARKALLVALALAALVSAACGDTIRPVAATVNGRTIGQDVLDDELEAIEANSAYVDSVEGQGFAVRGTAKGTLTNAFVGRVLTRQIFLFLVHDEFVRKKLTVSADELAGVEEQVVSSVGGAGVFEAFPTAYRRTLVRRNAEVAKLQESLSGDEVTDADVRAFYDTNSAQFGETCVSHILFAVSGPDGQVDQAATAAQADRLRSEATAARAEIAAGADFAAVAAAKSADASNKDQGGSLDCGGPGRFVPEFETAMDALQPNEVSEPVQTQFGFHLIKVTERRSQAFEEVSDQIRQQLESSGQAAFSDFLQQALDDADISVNPRYGTFSKNAQSPGVVPPGAPTTTVPGDPGTPASEPSPLQP